MCCSSISVSFARFPRGSLLIAENRKSNLRVQSPIKGVSTVRFNKVVCHFSPSHSWRDVVLGSLKKQQELFFSADEENMFNPRVFELGQRIPDFVLFPEIAAH